jgi:hypothetical protein
MVAVEDQEFLGAKMMGNVRPACIALRREIQVPHATHDICLLSYHLLLFLAKSSPSSQQLTLTRSFFLGFWSQMALALIIIIILIYTVKV